MQDHFLKKCYVHEAARCSVDVDPAVGAYTCPCAAIQVSFRVGVAHHIANVSDGSVSFCSSSILNEGMVAHVAKAA